MSEFVSGQVHVKDVRKRSKSLREFDIEEVSLVGRGLFERYTLREKPS